MRALAIFSLLIIILTAPLMAATSIVYPHGNVTVDTVAGGYINVATAGAGPVNVYQLNGGPGSNNVARYAECTGSPVVGGETSFGPFTNATTIRIITNADAAWYCVSPSTVPTPCIMQGPLNARSLLSTPSNYTTTATLLSTDLMNGVVTIVPTVVLTQFSLPTGTALDAATGLAVGQGIEWSIINTQTAASTDTGQLAAASNHTIVGATTIPALHSSTGAVYGSSARFFSRKTAANTFITYRIR